VLPKRVRPVDRVAADLTIKTGSSAADAAHSAYVKAESRLA
jgi:hypothetical protein